MPTLVRLATIWISALALCTVACARSAPPAAPTARPLSTAVAPPPPKPTSAPPSLSAPAEPFASPATAARRPSVVGLRPRVAVLGRLSEAGIVVGLAEGHFAAQGIEPQPVSVSSAAEALQALTSGQVEAACLPVGADLLNAFARNAPVRIVAEAAGSAAGHGAIGLLVRSDLVASVRTPTDLRGFRIGLPDRLGDLDVELWRLLKQGWLARTDVDTVPLPSDSLADALRRQQIDAVMVAEPALSALQMRGVGRVFRRSDETSPNRTTAVLVMSGRYLRSQPDAAREFVTGYLRAARAYDDAVARETPALRPITTEIAELTGLDADDLIRARLPSINPNGMVNVQSIRADQQFLLNSRLQAVAVDLASFIDPQYAAFAITQLGEYR